MNDYLIDIKNLAKQKFNISLYKDVIEIINNFLNDFSNCLDSEIYYIRGFAHQELKLYKNAIEDYNKAIELNPDNELDYHNRANAKYNIGLYEEAMKDYNKSLELNPNANIVLCDKNHFKDNK